MIVERQSSHLQKRDAVLPPPEVFNKYERVLPGSSEALIELVEKEQQHRHKLQKGYLMSYRLGQLLGFSFNIVMITLIANLYRYMPKESMAPHIFLGAYLFIFVVSLLDTRSDRKAVSLKAIKKFNRDGGRRDGRTQYNNRDRNNRDRRQSQRR